MYFDKESGRTAITRKKLSAPARYLESNALLEGRILDFGCGKGVDVGLLWNKWFDIHGYDPNHKPVEIKGKFDTIMCNYVLNVLPPKKVDEVLAKIKNLLAPGGVAYVAVRRDIKKEGRTSKGTLQYNVKLNLPVLVDKKGSFCIYELHSMNTKV